MPTYDYICAACAHAFEQFQTMSAKKLRRCPKCKKQALERQVGTGAGLIFKGTGFYITDYRKPDAAGDSSPAPSGDKKESGDKQNKGDKQGKGEKQHQQEGASKPASDAKGSAGGAPTAAAPSEKPALSKQALRPGRPEKK